MPDSPHLFPSSGDSTELIGEVKDVVYESADSGYAVLRIQVRGDPLPVTVTGSLFGLGAGTRVKVVGAFKEHPRFGRQFAVERHEEVLPRSKGGMIAFLASQFEGIGERLAEKIVDRFGDQTYEVLDSDATRVGEIPGVGSKKAEAIAAQWHERTAVRDAITLLQGYGIGPGQAMRVFRYYGDATVALVKQNPYRLADDVAGIGFKTADKIAQGLGIPKDSPERARAAVLYLLNDAGGEGHLLLPKEEVKRRAQLLEVDPLAIDGAISHLKEQRLAIVEDDAPDVPPAHDAPPSAEPTLVREDAPADDRAGAALPWTRRGTAVYLPRAHVEECGVAALLARLASEPDRKHGLENHVNAAARRAEIALADEQEAAVKSALVKRVAVITGGPGTGKTTIVRVLTDILRKNRVITRLAAPTGRAAKRLAEATGLEATTIHRLLHWNPKTRRFTHDESTPLEVDHLVLDECSMIDVPLASAVLRALPESASLTLVGDADQLPSVGPGDFLRAAVECGVLPVTRLQRVYRQRDGSRIVAGAHAVNRGEFPSFDPFGAGPSGELFFVEKDDPHAAAELIRRLVVERIPQAYGLDSKLDVQVLTPMHKGAAGAENLNAILGAALNPNPPREVVRGGRSFHVGDRVVCIKNDYEKNVFNGDQGFVVEVDVATSRLRVEIDERPVTFGFEELDLLLPAWATTVHRAQGGEHKAVVVALMNQHFPLLRRNLVYTAMTRAKRLCVIVGSRRALEIAIKNDAENDRYSWLLERLRSFRDVLRRAESP